MLARRELASRLARHAATVVGVSLIIAGALGAVHAAVTGTPFRESFQLMVFVPFLLLLAYGVLSGPGLFLARPKFAPIGPEARPRWRRWLAAPHVGTDQEFFELVLYVGIAFLLLAVATGIGFLLG